MFTEIVVFESGMLYSSILVRHGFFRCWMKSEVYKIKVDTTDEFLAPILDATASIKKREDQLRRTTRDLHTRVAKCTEVGGGICKHLL
jgi:hypothetical protein